MHAALGGICNRGLISQGGSVLVVDSGIAVAEAAPLRAAAAQERQKDGALYLLIRIPIAIMCMGTRYLRIVLSSRTEVCGIIWLHMESRRLLVGARIPIRQHW